MEGREKWIWMHLHICFQWALAPLSPALGHISTTSQQRKRVSSLPEDMYFMLKHLSCKSNPWETFCIIRGSRLSWRRLETRVDFKGGDGETYEDEVDSQRFLHTESEGKLRGQNSLELKLASRTTPPFYAKQALCHPKEKMDIGLILPSSQPVPASGWSPQFLATAV